VLPTSAEIYVDGFVARCHIMRRPDQRELASAGLNGLVSSTSDSATRLLVTDDRAYGALAELLPVIRAGLITVLASAGRCAELVERQGAWRPDTVTAMVHRELWTVTAMALPCGLTLRPVRRRANDPRNGVSLDDAVEAAMVASSAIRDPPEVLANYLRGLPSAFRLLVAVDGDAAVRATAGAGVFGEEGTVIFVNTDPDWRGRGIGRAMTAAALRSAVDSGARRASLDASDAGRSIYERLGFEAVARATRFFHTS
jgi:ribosomal protein S18 acetylase RimI-like enzyme